jgi:hypothetical protein
MKQIIDKFCGVYAEEYRDKHSMRYLHCPPFICKSMVDGGTSGTDRWFSARVREQIIDSIEGKVIKHESNKN